MFRQRLARLCLALCLAPCVMLPTPMLAQEVPEVDARALSGFDDSDPALFALLDAVGAYEILAIVAAESAASAGAVDAGVLGGRGGADWAATMAAIFSPERIVAEFEAAWPEGALTPEAVASLTAFYEGELGRRAVARELAARALIADEAAKETAILAYEDARADRDPMLGQIENFMAVNGFLDRNVMGALNANAAFLFGMAEGGALPIGQEEILARVMGQEPEIRAETESWLFAYQFMAYRDLGEAEMETYIAQTGSPEGQALTAAMFAAVGVVYETLQHELGRAAAEVLAGQDI